MNTILTVSCKLNPVQEQVKVLDRTLSVFADACNWVNAQVDSKVVSAIKMQKEVYYDIRSKFPLSANLAQQVCRRVAGNRKTARQKKRKVKSFKASSVTYDQRIFSLDSDNWTVSLTTVEGRQRISLSIGNYQRHLLKGQTPTGATLVKRKTGDYYLQVVTEHPTPEKGSTNSCIGVDLGRTDVAVTSYGQQWSGKNINQVRDHYAGMSQILQRKASKGTRSSRRRCRQLQRRLAGRSARFQSWLNHNISRAVVDVANAASTSIALEDLTSIRDRTNKQPRSKVERRRSNSWSFYQLRHYLLYKAELAGVEVVIVNPAYTSQTCHQCHHLGLRSSKSFKCRYCHWSGDADHNGAKNIAALGASVTRSGGPFLSCDLNRATEIIKAHALAAG